MSCYQIISKPSESSLAASFDSSSLLALDVESYDLIVPGVVTEGLDEVLPPRISLSEVRTGSRCELLSLELAETGSAISWKSSSISISASTTVYLAATISGYF